MTDGWIFLGISVVICLGVFLNGLRFARADTNPWAKKTMFGIKVEGSDMPLERVRKIGKLMMVSAVLFLVLASAMSIGLLGPVNGIRTIGS